MPDLMMDRRGLLAGIAALAGAPALAHAADPARPMRVALLGQSLIQQDLCNRGWGGMAAIARRLRTMDVVFTDLETAIDAPGAGPPMRTGEVFHAAKPAVIDCLRSLGVSAVTTANNHAGDMGPGGILAAIEQLDRRGIVHAGTGRTLDAAAAPAFQQTPAGAFALVSAAAGAIRQGAAATPERPGVHELRRSASGALEEADVARVLASIARARARGATVLMCLHNHYWEPVQADTAAWQKAFARRCVDAGAAAFVAHGTPLMQMWEMYRGAPLFHGLGNFIFQTRKADGFYGAATWRSMIVDARFARGRFVEARLLPLQLEANKFGGEYSAGVPQIDASQPATMVRASD